MPAQIFWPFWAEASACSMIAGVAACSVAMGLPVAG